MISIWFTVGSQQDTAKVSAAKVDLKVLADALQSYKLDVGKYPTKGEGLDALVIAPPAAKGWRGPYVRKPHPLDPWGQPYVYQATRVISYGQGGGGVETQVIQSLP